jgi:hypothetical protein
MTLGLVKERTTGTEPDHMVEFREVLELLKNEYPVKSPAETQTCIRKRQAKPLLYFVSRTFDCPCGTELGTSVGPLRDSGTAQT